MDNYVNAAETLQNRIGNCRATFGGCDIRRYEQILIRKAAPLTGCGEDSGTAVAQPRRHCMADPFRAAGHENPPAIKFVRIGFEFMCVHQFCLQRL
jgi:hypothetical protein